MFSQDDGHHAPGSTPSHRLPSAGPGGHVSTGVHKGAAQCLGHRGPAFVLPALETHTKQETLFNSLAIPGKHRGTGPQTFPAEQGVRWVRGPIPWFPGWGRTGAQASHDLECCLQGHRGERPRETRKSSKCLRPSWPRWGRRWPEADRGGTCGVTLQALGLSEAFKSSIQTFC